MNEHTYTDVFVFNKEKVFVAAISDELEDRGEDHALIFRWHQQKWVHWPITTAVGSLCVVDKPETMVFAMGIDGIVHVIKAPPNAIEVVDDSDNGPSKLVHLKCIRLIGNHVYVAGMARRVYRRETAGTWTAIDAGVFVPRAERDRGVGFNAIDGVSEQAIYAVGYDGEIWRYDGRRWYQEPSLTNVALTCVRCIGSDTVYAAGLAGVVLRSVNGTWETLNHDATQDDFWGMTVFEGRLYLAAYEGLFVVDGNDLLSVDMNLPERASTAYLDAKDGVMWSVGQKDLAYTDDGTIWKVVPGPG